jgi:hypothetical protein
MNTKFPVLAHLSGGFGRDAFSEFKIVVHPDDFPCSVNIKILKTNATPQDLDLILSAIRISEDIAIKNV